MSRFRTGKSKKYAKGQSIIEVMVGGFILIPLLLAIIDVSVVAIGGELVNRLSKEAARAAANCSNKTLADAAVVDIKNTFQPSSTFKNLNIAITDYVGTADGQLTVVCDVTVVLPVSVPLLKVGPTIPVKTQFTEAIVGIAPPR